ncbi:MAG: DUF4350 domain-containing protein [Dermatophilaceae bacterium]
MSTPVLERRADSYDAIGPTRSAVTHRVRGIVPWVVLLVLGALALAVLGARSGPEARLLDPRSPAPEGSRAIAEVLGRSGVDVSVVGTVAEVASGELAGTTVVVTADGLLSSERLAELSADAVDADRLVVLLTAPRFATALAPGLGAFSVPDTVSGPAAGCPVEAVRPGDVVSGAAVMLLASGGDGGAAGAGADDTLPTCLPARGIPDGGSLLARLPATQESPETLLVGFSPGLTNERITSEDNAAVALRMLGGSADLVWLIPSGIDAPSGAGSDRVSPWPPWATPVALVLAGGTVLLALVRGRRLGRLVPEPLPVIVRAAETTESRAHLYRRSRDRARTAAILRQGTRSRLRGRLGVERRASSTDLATAVAAATGEPRDRIQRILGDDVPATNAELVALGSDLADLERKVQLR